MWNTELLMAGWTTHEVFNKKGKQWKQVMRQAEQEVKTKIIEKEHCITKERQQQNNDTWYNERPLCT